MNWPPQGRRSPRQAGSSRYGTAGTPPHRKPGRSENQAELESLFAPATQWAVTVRKATSGAVVVFSLHDSERESDSVVSPFT